MKIKLIPSRTDVASVKDYIKAVKAGKNSKPKVVLSESKELSKAIKNFDNQKKIIDRARSSEKISNNREKNKK